MIWVRIPLDMEVFLLYMVYHSREMSNINLPAAHYDTNSDDRGTKIEGCDAHACWKQNKTINYGDKAAHIRHHRSFNWAFFSTLFAIIGHFASLRGDP